MMEWRRLWRQLWSWVLGVSVRLKIMGIATACILLLGLGMTLYIRRTLIHDLRVPGEMVNGFTVRFVVATVVVALVGMGIAYLLMTIMTNPILELVAVTKAVAQGQMGRRARLWANDEVGKLSAAFNVMVEQLERSIAELQRINEELREKNAKLSRLGEELRRRDEARLQVLGRLIIAQEEERRRVARELHDQTGQHLTALMLGLKALEDPCQSLPSADERVRQLQELTRQLMQEVHHLAWELRPAALDDWGLLTALRRYTDEWAQRGGVSVDFHSSGLDGLRLPPHIETTVYRVVQEALTNVLKHAQAHRVSVLLERRPDHILAIVEDDGRGFNAEAVMDASDAQRKLGLLGMQERAALVGGTLQIESTPGAGTTVFVRIPLGEQ